MYTCTYNVHMHVHDPHPHVKESHTGRPLPPKSAAGLIWLSFSVSTMSLCVTCVVNTGLDSLEDSRSRSEGLYGSTKRRCWQGSVVCKRVRNGAERREARSASHVRRKHPGTAASQAVRLSCEPNMLTHTIITISLALVTSLLADPVDDTLVIAAAGGGRSGVARRQRGGDRGEGCTNIVPDVRVEELASTCQRIMAACNRSPKHARAGRLYTCKGLYHHQTPSPTTRKCDQSSRIRICTRAISSKHVRPTCCAQKVGAVHITICHTLSVSTALSHAGSRGLGEPITIPAV
jgi:hypothetical protein